MNNGKVDVRRVTLSSATDGVVLAASWVLASRNGATRFEQKFILVFVVFIGYTIYWEFLSLLSF